MTVRALLHVLVISQLLSLGAYPSFTDFGPSANRLEFYPSRILQEVWFGHELVRFCNRLPACLLTQYRSGSASVIRTPSANWGKHGYTCLAVPGHDPPIDLTIFNDVSQNPGPDG